jgi:hypothetical protein
MKLKKSTAHKRTCSSGYQNDLYDMLLSGERGWAKESLKATTKGNNGKCFERHEVLWFNSAYSETLRSGRLPLRLSKREKPLEDGLRRHVPS